MERIKQKIDEYNNTVVELFGEDDEYYSIDSPNSATENEIKNLEQAIGLPIPKELNKFYTIFGRLKNKGNNESYCFEIPEPSKLIQISLDKSCGEFASFGLIDMIIYSWGNDREEFQKYQYISAEQTKQINSKYKCFGWYRNDTILESAYYLYFDENENFGTLFYGQDTPNEAFQELKNILNTSIKNISLENILLEALDKTRITMIEWNE